MTVKNTPTPTDDSVWITKHLTDNTLIRLRKDWYVPETPAGPSGAISFVDWPVTRSSTSPNQVLEIIHLGTPPLKVTLTQAECEALGAFFLEQFEVHKAKEQVEKDLKERIETLIHQVAEEKGWDLVKELLPANDFDALQRNEWITVRGSDNHDWRIKRDGNVERGGTDMTKFLRPKDEKALRGTITKYNYGNAGWVFPDALAAIIKLIQHDAHRLVRKWGCGNLSVEGGDIVQ